jgi:3-hydroxyisobutyrate dehydrogenase
MTRIGFIGLGHMGNPMAKNLIHHGYDVIVYDIAPASIESLAGLGATAAANPLELANNADIIITMLQTGAQVTDICLGEEGIFNALGNNNLYIDSSSIDIVTSRQLHQIAREKNIAMVDAPVSGGVAGARAATLTFMVGGTEQHFLQAQPILQCMGKQIIHAGAAGNGQVAKICNNMILGISMIAVSEGFVLAKKLGLEPSTFFEIANNASSQCWSMSKYCPMPGVLDNVPSNNGYVPGFTASMMLKDLKLSQDAALHADVPTPLGAEATALYSLFVNEGYADLDFSGIIKMLGEYE